MKLKLKVVPNSSKDCLMGLLGDAVKIKIKAPPENAKANAAVEKFLAKKLKIPNKQVKIISGLTQANKTAEILGLEEKDVLLKLAVS